MILLIIAWRNIWRNKMRSLIIMMSVAIGLFCGMMVLSIYKGMMKGRVKTVIESETGSIQIHNKQFREDYDPTFTISNSANLLNLIRHHPEVWAFAERSVTQGMLSTSTGSTGVQINGIQLNQEAAASGLNKKLLDKSNIYLLQKGQLLLGKKLAAKMKLYKGSKLVLTFSDSASNLISAAFRVAGLYESDNAPLDELNVYIQQAELNDLLGIGNSIHELVILLRDDKKMESVTRELKQQFPNYAIESWKELSPETELMVNTIDVYSYIIILIIMLALSFGIINTMLMAVLERTKEIGMTIALGMNKIKMFFLILMETIFLTLAGVPLGFLLSLGVISYYSKRGMDWSGMGKEMMSSFGFSTTIYPVFPGENIYAIIMIVITTALLSCIIPAIRALRLQPADALRK